MESDDGIVTQLVERSHGQKLVNEVRLNPIIFRFNRSFFGIETRNHPMKSYAEVDDISLQVLNLVAFSLLLLINSCGLGSVSRFYAAEMVPKSILLSTTSILSGLEILLKIASEVGKSPIVIVHQHKFTSK